MERAVRLIQKNKLSRHVIAGDEIVRAIWPEAVGKAIAGHTSRLHLVRTTLVVEVEDATWQRQLFVLSSQILARIQKLTGGNEIKDLEFRIAVPRRQPARALQAESAIDDADSIGDDGLRRLYRSSRKKASA